MQLHSITVVMGAILLGETYKNASIQPKPDIPDWLPIRDDQKPQIARQVGENTVDALMLQTIPESVDITLREIDQAERLAQERGVDVAAIYKDDNLYATLVSRTHTPQSLASIYISLAERMTHQVAEQISLEGIRIILLAALQNQRLSDETLQERYDNFSELLEELRKTPLVQDEVERTVHRCRKGLYLVAALEVEKYWGSEGLNQLSDNMINGIQQYREEPQNPK